MNSWPAHLVLGHAEEHDDRAAQVGRRRAAGTARSRCAGCGGADRAPCCAAGSALTTCRALARSRRVRLDRGSRRLDPLTAGTRRAGAQVAAERAVVRDQRSPEAVHAAAVAGQAGAADGDAERGVDQRRPVDACCARCPRPACRAAPTSAGPGRAGRSGAARRRGSGPGGGPAAGCRTPSDAQVVPDVGAAAAPAAGSRPGWPPRTPRPAGRAAPRSAGALGCRRTRRSRSACQAAGRGAA